MTAVILLWDGPWWAPIAALGAGYVVPKIARVIARAIRGSGPGAPDR